EALDPRFTSELTSLMFNSFHLRKALSHLRNFVQFSKDYLVDNDAINLIIISLSAYRCQEKVEITFSLRSELLAHDNFYIIPTFSSDVNNYF
ncbi:hypothetical protein, partial [Lacticaseibacillus jixiensis]|uniref:hypothetical protein n=1 Tax=Lacticaseibacillus jixiensis TaxID=3231926 RepID=UPI0036F2D451